MAEQQMANIVNMDSPEAVLDEVLVILDLISAKFDAAPVTAAFNTAVSLFKGTYPGYQACTTGFHDLRHTTDTFLSMARLIHGAVLEGESFSHRQMALGLITALLHDAGYIQEEHDREGTGGKYTATHVQRSMDFLERSSAEYGLSKEEIADGQAMILCTSLTEDFSTMVFSSPEIELLGKMLATADLLAQMADRLYLEKLLFLFHEFTEGKVAAYESEADLIRNTVGFYASMTKRLDTTLGAADHFMGPHFASRWNIEANLYHEAMEKHKNHLQKILEVPDADPHDYLRRAGIAKEVHKIYRRKNRA
jgi:hypothetical protein